MADKLDVSEIADIMYKLIERYAGKKKFKPNDLTKEVISEYGEDRVSKKDCKMAIRSLIDSGRCVYGYFGGSSIEIPPKE
jgi:hypothetical protein